MLQIAQSTAIEAAPIQDLKTMLINEIPAFVHGRKTEATAKAYKRDLTHYFENIDAVTFGETQRYFNELSEQYAKSTIVRKKAALSKFYDVVLEKAKIMGYDLGELNLNFFTTNIIKETVARSVKQAAKHGKKTLPKHLEWWEVEQILAKINEKPSRLVSLRDTLIILFGVYGGMRRSEMVNAKWSDITDRGQALTIDGKGGEDKIHLHKRVVETLEELKQEYSHWKIDSEYILISTTTRSFGKQMTNLQINRIVEKLTQDINKITVHDLRHTCAVSLIQRGAGIEAVAKHLRHKNIETTRIYLQSIELHKNAAADLLPDQR